MILILLQTTGNAPVSTQSSPGSYLTQAEVEKLVADAEKVSVLLKVHSECETNKTPVPFAHGKDRKILSQSIFVSCY